VFHVLLTLSALTLMGLEQLCQFTVVASFKIFHKSVLCLGHGLCRLLCSLSSFRGSLRTTLLGLFMCYFPLFFQDAVLSRHHSGIMQTLWLEQRHTHTAHPT